jgi:DNA-binding IclR family transcriptional regulator
MTRTLNLMSEHSAGHDFLSNELLCFCPHCGRKIAVRPNAAALEVPLIESPHQTRQGAQAIRRALAVLRILATGRETGVGLMDVVQSTGLTRPTVHRIIHALVEEGIVEKHERTGRYAIGQQVPELALARQSRSPLLVAADPLLADLSQQLGDTLFLTARTGLDTLCVARRIGSYPIQVLSIEVGARRPLGVSSAGIAMLAAMPAKNARSITTANATRFEPYQTNVAAVLDMIDRTRRRGYSLREVGLVPGTKSVSICIRKADGDPAAALTITAIRNRLTHRRESEVVEALQHATRSIERSLKKS